MNTERILPKIILVNWRDKLILKQWKLGVLEHGNEQSRREQDVLQEELADRERARRDTRIRSIPMLEELKREQGSRLGEFSIRQLVENHLKDVRICTQWTIISRSNSTSVISSSSWTRRIAKPRLKFAAKYMGYAWYIGKRFCKSTSVFFDNLWWNAHSLELISLSRETRNRQMVIETTTDLEPKWTKIPKSFSIFSFNFFILEETIDWNSNALPEGLYLNNDKVKMSQVSAKRWKEKIGGKVREEGPCAQSIWKQSQPQCWP